MAVKYWYSSGNANWASNNWYTSAPTAGGPVGTGTTFNTIDDAVFTQFSGSATVTIAASQSARSVKMTGFQGTLAGSSTLTITGSDTGTNAGDTLILTSTGGYTFTGAISFNSSYGGKVTTAGRTLRNVTFINNGTWALQDNFTMSSASTLTFTSATLTSSFDISTGLFTSAGSGVRNITATNFYLTGTGTVWTSSGTNFTNNTTSIYITDTSGTGKTISCAAAAQAPATFYLQGNAINIGAGVVKNINISNTSTATITITGAATCSSLVCNASYSGTIAGSSTLAINGGDGTVDNYSLFLSTGCTLTYSSTMTFSGTSGPYSIFLNGKSIPFALTFSGAGGTWNFLDYLYMSDDTKVLTHSAGTINFNGQSSTNITLRAPTWTANTTTALGTYIYPTTYPATPTTVIWQCTALAGGTATGATEPSWPASPTINVTTVSDGNVTWTARSTNRLYTWAANKIYSLGTMIYPSTYPATPSSYIWEVTSTSLRVDGSAGQSGSTEPSWPASPTIGVTTVNDGDLVWTARSAKYNATLGRYTSSGTGSKTLNAYNLELTGAGAAVGNTVNCWLSSGSGLDISGVANLFITNVNGLGRRFIEPGATTLTFKNIWFFGDNGDYNGIITNDLTCDNIFVNIKTATTAFFIGGSSVVATVINNMLDFMDSICTWNSGGSPQDVNIFGDVRLTSSLVFVTTNDLHFVRTNSNGWSSLFTANNTDAYSRAIYCDADSEATVKLIGSFVTSVASIGDYIINSGTFIFDSYTYTPVDLNVNGGKMIIPAGTTIGPMTGVSIGFNVAGGTVDLYGTVDCANSYFSSGTLNIKSGGLFTGDSTFSLTGATISVDSGGTLSQISNLTMSAGTLTVNGTIDLPTVGTALTITGGTINFNSGSSVSLNRFTGTGTGARILNLPADGVTIEITGWTSAAVSQWSLEDTTNFTITNLEASTIKFTNATNNDVYFRSSTTGGPSLSYGTVWFARPSSGSNYLLGSSYFKVLADGDYPYGSGTLTPVAHSLRIEESLVNYFENFVVNGASAAARTILNTPSGTLATVAYQYNGNTAVVCNFLDIRHQLAAPANKWFCYSSVNLGSPVDGTGWNNSTTNNATAQTPLYWVGRSGPPYNWNDTSNWANSSGGTGPATPTALPNYGTRLIFDNNAINKTVSINVDAECADMTITNFSGGSFTFTGSANSLSVNGSLIETTTSTLTTLANTTSQYVKIIASGALDYISPSSGSNLSLNFQTECTGAGEVHLTNNLVTTGYVKILGGTFGTGPVSTFYDLTCSYIKANVSSTITEFNSSTITITGRDSSDNICLDLRQSSLVTTSANVINITDSTNNAITFYGNGLNYPSVQFKRGASTGDINIYSGGSIFTTFKDSYPDCTEAHTIYWDAGSSNNSVTYTFGTGSGKGFIVNSPSSSKRITINSIGTTYKYNFVSLGSSSNPNPVCSFLDVYNSSASPANTFYTTGAIAATTTGWVGASGKKSLALLGVG